MSIKPIDYNVMVPKIQEVSSAKQIENLKNRNIIESTFVKQEKIIRNNRQKVMDISRGTNNKIHDDQKHNNQGNYNSKERKKTNESLSKQEIEDLSIGNNIDICI